VIGINGFDDLEAEIAHHVGCMHTDELFVLDDQDHRLSA